MRRPPLSLKGRALRYLSMREHSRLELARKLARYAQETDDIDALLDALEVAGLLSQERFTESLVRRRATRFGNQRILSELQTHGVAAETLRLVKSKLAEDEVTRATDVHSKKFSHPPKDAAERAKHMRFLQQRGFSSQAIQAVMRRAERGDDAPSDD
ncbi:MAG: recombination regulator RecX [Proteobacteria bacterium]|nr:recombination regulator RecX [Pseudomonadota bacterium]